MQVFHPQAVSLLAATGNSLGLRVITPCLSYYSHVQAISRTRAHIQYSKFKRQRIRSESKKRISSFVIIVRRRMVNKCSTTQRKKCTIAEEFNPLNPELNPIYLLALLGAHRFLHVSRIRVKLLTFRLLMS